MTSKTLGQAAAPTMRALADKMHSAKADYCIAKIRQCIETRDPTALALWSYHLGQVAEAWKRDHREYPVQQSEAAE